MKKWFVILGVLLLTIPCYAAGQGDFQVFKLGDTKEQTDQKIKDYNDKARLVTLDKDLDTFQLRQDDIGVACFFENNILSRISIVFPYNYKETGDNKGLALYLRHWLTEVYGEPTELNYYPDHTVSEHRYMAFRWTMDTKIVEIAVLADRDNNHEVSVEMYLPGTDIGENDDLKDFG